MRNARLFFSLLSAFAVTALTTTSFAADARPNIIFIIADDLGWADVAFHGGNAPTPNLDQLAREGLELTRHYVAPVCSPTRTGLMTGRCWSRFNVTTPQNERALPWDTMTLPKALKSAGYDTCITGKWHLGSKPEWGPNHFGFDHSYGSLAGGVGPWDHSYKKGPFSPTWHRNEKLMEEKGHVTDLITEEAVRWLEARGEKPFFLYVPFTAVHLPIKEPDEYVQRVPASIQGDMRRQYAACVMHLDSAVGRLVGALEKTGKRSNTIVVFTSDNGGITVENNDTNYPDDDYPAGRLAGSNVPLRGEKGQVYEGGIHVPAIVNWPGKAKPGKLDVPLQITDWMPTFCGLAEYKPSRDLKWDGRNMASLLKGEVNSSAPCPVYTVAPGWRARALHFGDWKLIELGAGKNAPKYELYNLGQDLSETTDLADKEPARLADLQQHLKRMAANDKDSVVVEGNN